MNTNTSIVELFGQSTSDNSIGWKTVVKDQACPFLNRTCIKTRKSNPEIAIGTCTVKYGRDEDAIIICPHRLIEKRQIFIDAIHLLAYHEPGNELHIVPEVGVPGGSVDYFLVSVKDSLIVDFVGIELQTLDTTGTVWPARQKFLESRNLLLEERPNYGTKSFGMNWKMTAKTILVQLHHKIQTFEHLNRHLVLVMQDHLINYMKKEFSFDHLRTPASLGDSMHFHSYNLIQTKREAWKLRLHSRFSTTSEGIQEALGLQAEAKVEFEMILNVLKTKISELTLLKI